MVLSPDKVASKWNRNLKNAIQDLRDGVDAVTEAPSARAIARKEKMRANILAAIDDGRWEAGLAGYTLAQWKQDMKTKAADRIPSGADAGQSKMRDYMAVALPHIEAGLSKIASMPDLTLADSKARVAAWIDHMHELKKRSR